MIKGKQVLLTLDQLGNVLCGGFADQTISGRVGYMSRQTAHREKWDPLRAKIDKAFEPIDGKGHCYMSYESDRQVAKHTTSGYYRVVLLVNIFTPLLGFIIKHVVAPKGKKDD